MATILFITTRIPYPPYEGHQIRSYNLLKHVCSVHNVHLLTFARKEEGISGIKHLETLCASVSAVEIPVEHNPIRWMRELAAGLITEKPFVIRKYCSAQMIRKIRECIEQKSPDLVHFDMLPLAQYRLWCENLPVILDEHNVESLLLERRAKEGCRNRGCAIFFMNQAKKLRHFETAACGGVDQVLACSSDDAEMLRSMAEGCSVEVVANGVALDYFLPQEAIDRDPHNMVFVGGMGWFPNRDGMDYFLKEVMPLVCREIPEATCTIVGKADELKVPKDLVSKVHLAGFVDDLRPWVWRAGIYVLPLRLGSGTRLKLLEAMAMEKPIVSTPVGCEGVDVSHERELLVAEQPDEMAEAIVRLMRNPGLAHALGEQARRKAVEAYDWNVIGERLLNIYRMLLARKG